MMWPIRKSAMAMLAGCAALAGCQSYKAPQMNLPPAMQIHMDQVRAVQLYHEPGLARVNETPIEADDAMATRSDWAITPAIYESLSMTAGSPEIPLEPSDNLNLAERGIMELPLFLANILVSPISVAYTPLWGEYETAALKMPPSYTANPPLAPINGSDYSGRALGGGWESVRSDKSGG